MVKIKKFKKAMLFLLTLSFLPFLKSDFPVIQEEHSLKLLYEKEYKDQLNNFTFLVKSVSLMDQTSIHSTASGMIISSTKSHIFVLTADHFCSSPEDELFKTEIIVNNSDAPRLSQIIFKDPKNDICLLSAIKYKGEKFKNIKLAKKMPALGEFVFNVAAPNGIGSPKTRLLFDGYFGGCEDMCLYTIPATFGSSGSAVFNDKGELISILVMATEDFENVGIGPDIYKIKIFLDKLDEIMEIRWNCLLIET